MASNISVCINAYLAYVQSVTFDFGAYGRGMSKIEYYVNKIG